MPLLFELIKTGAACIGALSIIYGAVFAFAGDAVVPASKQYVHEKNAPLREVQIDIANGKIEQHDAQRTLLEIEVLKSNDPEVKAKAGQAIRRIDRNIDALNDQVRALRAQR